MAPGSGTPNLNGNSRQPERYFDPYTGEYIRKAISPKVVSYQAKKRSLSYLERPSLREEKWPLAARITFAFTISVTLWTAIIWGVLAIFA